MALAWPWSAEARRLVDTLQPSTGAWAAFDFDNTIIHGDITEALLAELIRTQAVPPANFAGLPPVRIDETLREANEDPAGYYLQLCSSSTRNGVHYGECGATGFVIQLLTGLSLHQLTTVLARLPIVRTERFVPEPNPGRWGEPILRQPVVHLIGELIQRGIPVRILSAGIVWAVRWYVHTVLNPELTRQFGPGVQVDLADVCAIGGVLYDTRQAGFATDRMHTYDQSYLRLDPDTAAKLLITRLPDGPMTFADGKTAGALERFGTAHPLLMVGDSGGDLAMWQHSTHRLWLRDLDNPATATLASQLPAPYVVQPLDA